MHSQTKKHHQKMLMDMILSIKKNNTKKQKISHQKIISHMKTSKDGVDGVESSEMTKWLIGRPFFLT
ncbi:hypothetical protein GIB67_038217 [Kingdonia uniflora]|uniref:Uncharacterized protein n=1 Tax=Kingdonia uniflora TaxID=39325 RepID=A0A7J7NHJ9_9MAGN|nr:hypothetical protein GIB67_038217 [Kingdonia uniflora]